MTALSLSVLFASAKGAEVRAFGAKGDGIADDTAAVRAAVQAGGGVVFSKGVYRITETIAVELDRNGFTSLSGDGTARVVMAGAGPAFKFIGTHGGSAAPKDFKPEVWERQRAPMVDGIEIVGAHPEANGIEATGTMQLTISRVIVREARHGIHLTTRNRNVIISACHLYHNTGIGVYYDAVDLHQSNIVGCHISYNAGGGVVTRGGGVRNLHIGTCDIESNMTAEGPATANVLIDCSGGSTAEVTIAGCTLQHNTAGPESANVRFIGRGADRAGKAASEVQWGHLTIADNVLSDVMVNVHLQHARGVVITGNTFGAGHAYDLVVEESSNVVVGTNTFDRNPRYFSGMNAKALGGLLFRDSRDCSLTGMHVNGVRGHAAAVTLKGCENFNVTNCAILESEGAAFSLEGTSRTKVSGCSVRSAGAALRVTGGEKNWITQNLLEGALEVGEETARVEGNWDGR